MSGAGTPTDNDPGRSLWELLPRPMRLLDRAGVVAEARRFCMSVGAIVEELLARTMYLRRNRFPVIADENALPILGEQRWLPRQVGESIDEWRGRLRQAFAIHQEGGTNAGVVRVLVILGYTTAAIVEHQGSVPYYAGVWSYDGTVFYALPGDNWALFDVVVDESEWDNDPAAVALARAAINKTKAGHAMFNEFQCESTLTYDGSLSYDGSWKYDGKTRFWK